MRWLGMRRACTSSHVAIPCLHLLLYLQIFAITAVSSIDTHTRSPASTFAVNMTATDSDYSEKHAKTPTQADEEQDYASKVGWKALFAFTTTSHIAVLLSALASAAIAAATLPVFSVIYGLVFGAYSDYGAEKLDGDGLLSEVTRLCLIMTGIAAASWILNSIFFFLFLLLGELQAKSARTRVFDALIQKDMAWFDMRESGIAAFLPTIQM